MEYIGKKDEVSAPSAVIRLNKFGNLKEIKKISEKIPAPKKAAMKTSLTYPDMRLKVVKKADWVKPPKKKDVLFFVNFLIYVIFNL